MVTFPKWWLRAVPEPITEIFPEPVAPMLREPLAAAQIRLQEAKRLLDEAIAGTERVRDTIPAAVLAEAEAAEAEAACVQAATEWASKGAPGGVANEDLYERATATRQRANRAKLIAQGAEEALKVKVWGHPMSVTQAEADARRAFENAQGAVHAAVTAVLVEEIQPTLQRALELHSELLELLPAIEGFARLQKQNVPFRPPGKALAGLDQLRMVPTYNDEQLLNLMSPWCSFGDRLVADPEAQF